jgi:hypothetical protein
MQSNETPAWIASLALAMTSRSRDASQHPSYATPFPVLVTTGLDAVVHADVVLAKRRWKRFASDAAAWIAGSSKPVARMKRSEIRGNRCCFDLAPGLRSAPSGLRKNEKIGSKTPTDARLFCRAMRARPRLRKREAHICRRSTAALARGTLVPKAQRQARLPGT